MKIRLLLLFLVAALHGRAQDLLVPFRQGDRWGWADSTARVQIAPAWGWVDFFELHTAAAQVSGQAPGMEPRYGLVGLDGRVLVPPVYRSLEPSPNTRSLPVGPLQEYHASERHRQNVRFDPATGEDDWAQVYRDNDRFHDSIRRRLRDTCFVAINEGGRQGLLDRGWRVRIPFIYDSISFVWFRNDRPLYRVRQNGGRWVLSDADGKLLSGFQYLRIEPGYRYEEKDVVVDLVEEEAPPPVVVPQKPKPAAAPKAPKTRPEPVDTTRYYGVIFNAGSFMGIRKSTTGTVLLPAVYDLVYTGPYPYVFLRSKGRFGLAHQNSGTVLLPPVYASLEPLDKYGSHTLIATDSAGRKGLFGGCRLLVPVRYDSICRIGFQRESPYVAARNAGKWSVYYNGERLPAGPFEELGCVVELDGREDRYYVAARAGNLWGVVDQAGRTVLPFTWKQAPGLMSSYDGSVVLTREKGLTGLYFRAQPERSIWPAFVSVSSHIYRHDSPRRFRYFRVTDARGRFYLVSESGYVFFKE